MVKRDTDIEYSTGYGSKSSEDNYTWLYIPECDCNITFRTEDTDKKEITNDLALFHEHFHKIKDEIGAYIEKNGDQTAGIIMERFIHVPVTMIEYALEWLSAKVSKYWIRNITEELFNKPILM